MIEESYDGWPEAQQRTAACILVRKGLVSLLQKYRFLAPIVLLTGGVLYSEATDLHCSLPVSKHDLLFHYDRHDKLTIQL